MKSVKLFICAIALIVMAPMTASAQTGKIAGTVVDAETGNPLPGVNVLVVGTQRGATTNAEGQYTIINVEPGSHDVRASFVGFATQTVEGVDVSIDLTTQVDFDLQESTAQLDEITVQATEQVVQQDLSASRVDISSEDMENLPVADVESVIGLQAGVQGLSIRGSGADEADFRLDGLSLSQGRSGTPYTGVSMTAVEEVQVQSGGFSAEYGDMRSGVVNVVTKEGPRDHYTAEAIFRYSSPSSKHFGIGPSDPGSYWMRSYLDEEVAFEGTDQWDEYTQQQFPEFQGFNELASGNPDLTPEQAQDLFEYRHRRDLAINSPDYVIDGGFGGPVPVVSPYLGDLRFFATYRREQSQYITPLSRDGYDEYNARLKLTSNITPMMKLTLQGMSGSQAGSNNDAIARQGGATAIRLDGDRQEISGYGDGVNYNPGYQYGGTGIFANSLWSVSDIDHNMLAANLNHTIGESTFYEFYIQRFESSYSTVPPRARDTSTVTTFGGVEVDEGPIGFSFESQNTLTGLRMGAHHAEFRDTSSVAEWNVKLDVTSQINQTNQVKAGFQFRFGNQDIRYGFHDFLLNPPDIYAGWEASPTYGALYVRDKLEFEGMIANAGLRLDYMNPNTDWFEFSPYTEAFLGKNKGQLEEMLEQGPVEPKLYLSPRLGVSFPITENSKLYFNYGHFVQTLDPEQLYLVERMRITDEVSRIANPEAPLPKTVSYELGYEQNLFDVMLVRLAGYYKDESNQPRLVNYTSRSGLINYAVNQGDTYEDIRGFEASLFKNVGKWFRGFINYTYEVRSEGSFGFSQFYENRVDQREYERETTDHYQFKPLPQPFARASLTLLSPSDYGPEYSGLHPLGGWNLNLLARWQSGSYFTYTGNYTIPELNNNVQWGGYKMADLRVSKNFELQGVGAQIFADVKNVFNVRNLNHSSFVGANDFDLYMESLHLQEDVFGDPDAFSAGVPGDDQPGDYREPGAPYVPIEVVGSTGDVTTPQTRPLYYVTGDNGDATYMWYRDGELQEADQGYVDTVLENKQYIDMPNAQAFRFLFPRDVYFGIRLSF